jgi:signal transduction histidine kinase
MTGQRELAHPLALLFAVFAMLVGVVFVGYVRSLVGPESRLALELTVVAVLGVVAYTFVLWTVRHLMRSVHVTSDVLSAVSANSVSDPVAVVRTEFRKLASLPYPREFAQLGVAVDRLLGVAQDSQARQTAWTVATVHDMKASLAAGANTVETIARRAAPADAAVLKAIGHELRQLASDVQRMVDVVRFAHSDIEVGSEHIELSELIADVVTRVPARDGVQVSLQGHGAVTGDRRMLSRAIENLVSNAVRYARSHVAIEVLPGLVRVADDGGGLSAPFAELSMPFRSDSMMVSGVRVDGGIGGIGLFMARRVFELHGGRLSVESTGPSGTVFLAYLGSVRGHHG